MNAPARVAPLTRVSPLTFLLRAAALVAALCAVFLLLAAAAVRYALPAFLEGPALREIVAETLPGYRVRVGDAEIRLGWGGLFLLIRDFDLADPAGRPVMRFARAAARWTAAPDVFAAAPRITAVTIAVDKPVFYLRRAADGQWGGALPPLNAAGLPAISGLPGGGKIEIGEGFALLRDARLEMHDDSGQLPPLLAAGATVAVHLHANGDLRFRLDAPPTATLQLGETRLARELTVAGLLVGGDAPHGRFYLGGGDIRLPSLDAQLSPGAAPSDGAQQPSFDSALAAEWQNLDAQIWGEFGAGLARLTVIADAAEFSADAADLSAVAGAVSGRVRAVLEGGFLRGESGLPRPRSVWFDIGGGGGGELAIPGVFLRPIAVDRIAAAGEWRRGANKNWALDLTRLSFANADAAVEMSGGFAGAGAQVAVMDFAGRLLRGRAEAVHHYLPLAMDLEAREWLRDSLAAGGDLNSWSFHAGGAPGDFPYAGGDGEFYLGGGFADTVFAYAPGWPALESAAGEVHFNNAELTFTGRGEIGAIKIAAVRGGVGDLSAANPTLVVTVQSAARAEAYLAATADFPPTRGLFADETPLQIAGRAALAVEARVPLAEGEADYRAALLLAQSRARIAGFDFNAVSATVLFAGEQARGRARALFLGEEVAVTLSLASGVREAGLRGDFDLAEAAARFGAPQLTAVAGGGGRATVFYAKRGAAERILFSSDLAGVSVSLPAPFGKRAAEVAPLELEWRGGEEIQVNFRNGLARARIKDGGAHLAFNQAPPQGEIPAGVSVAGYLDELDLDVWRGWQSGDGAGGGIGIGAVDLTVADARLFALAHRPLTLRLTPQSAAQTVIVLSSDKAAGRALWTKNRLAVSLSHLLLPEGGDGGETISAEDEIPAPPPDLSRASQLPALSVTVSRLEYGRRNLGPFLLRGHPVPRRGWRVAALQIGAGDNAAAAAGYIAGGRTSLRVTLTARDAPQFFADLGYPGLLASGAFAAAGTLDWRGGLADVGPGRLNGDIALSCENVRYAEAKPGAAKLLALFSPQSLFSLGFADALGAGVVFDEIAGDIQIQSGIARARDLKLESEEAIVTMTGQADLAQQTYAIRGRVRPGKSSLGLVTLATGLEPTTALITWVLGKIFEKPISEIGAYDFTVTGPWEDPVYEEVGALPTESVR